MTNILQTIYSPEYGLGAISGIIAYKVWIFACLRYKDRVRPLPSGRRRRAVGINPVWAAAAILLAVLGYVLFQTQQTETHYRALADDVARCQHEFAQALIARSQISMENDRLSREQRQLLADGGSTVAGWISQLVNPPPDIAALDLYTERRAAWNLDTTRIYFGRITEINQRIQKISDQQRYLEMARAQHPLPQQTCGR